MVERMVALMVEKMVEMTVVLMVEKMVASKVGMKAALTV
jgi:hypothetical protein